MVQLFLMRNFSNTAFSVMQRLVYVQMLNILKDHNSSKISVTSRPIGTRILRRMSTEIQGQFRKVINCYKRIGYKLNVT